jgi:hypothetical protein
MLLTIDVMAAPPPPDEAPQGVLQGALRDEYIKLGTIRATFSATPPDVKPFSTTSISWHISIPSTLKIPVQFHISSQQLSGLSGTLSGLSGTMTVQLIEDTAITLTADGPNISRDIKVFIIKSDTTTCKHSQIFGGSRVVENMIKSAIKNGFTGSQIQIDSDKLQVHFGNARLTIVIIGNISIPDWFDMTMTINASFSLGIVKAQPPERHIFVSAGTTNVDVTVGKLSTGLSLGYAKAAGRGAEEAAKSLIAEIAANQISPMLSSALSQVIDKDILDTEGDLCKAGSSRYALISAQFTADELFYTVCPMPSLAAVNKQPRPLPVRELRPSTPQH